MLSFLPSPLKGVLSFLIYLINTILLTVPLILVSLLKFILPFQPAVVILDKILMGMAGLWIYINSLTTDLFCEIDWDIRGLDKLNARQWYLVLSNHQSWVDILVLQKMLRKKIPMLKFFLKKELIWVPFLGLAWWALDFPFMKRYSKEFLAQNPHLKGKDLESTRKACQKFKHTPVSIMNFVEGTRYTPEKAKNSAFSHLLTPRAGGIAFVLGSMGQYLDHIIDVTIVYPGRVPSFWSFISGKTRKIIVDFQLLEVGWHIKGDYFNDPVFKERFCKWLNQLWHEKDRKIERLLS
ncbi:MAG: acyltransferase [Desulfotignum sp.]|nr:acyltransferase [Desulfotignum sp.]